MPIRSAHAHTGHCRVLTLLASAGLGLALSLHAADPVPAQAPIETVVPAVASEDALLDSSLPASPAARRLALTARRASLPPWWARLRDWWTMDDTDDSDDTMASDAPLRAVVTPHAVPTSVSGFTGSFAPANFTLTNSNANGLVDTSNAPSSISLTGGDNQSGTAGSTAYTATAPLAGRVGFSYAYVTSDPSGPAADPFGYAQNGSFVQLTNDSGANSQSGTATFAIGAGQLLGFQLNTVDNLRGSATAKVSNFLFSNTAYWKGNVNNTWTANNWTLDAAGTVSTFTPDANLNVVFSATGASNLSTTLGANVEISSLTIGGSSNVTIAGAYTLTISGSAGTTGITVNSGVPALTISSGLTLAGSSQTIVVNGLIANINGAISGTVGLTKSGTGFLFLTSTNTYTGPTNVNAGTLGVNGANSGTGLITVQNSGSTLGGTGTLAGAVTVTNSGRLSPGPISFTGGAVGNSGRLTVGALTLSSTATSLFDIGNGSIYDQLFANGNIALGGSTLALNVNTASVDFAVGQVLDLFHNNSGTLSGVFSNFTDNGLYTYGNDTFQAHYTATDFTLTVTSVPEPATWAGGALLLAAAGCARRRHLCRA